MNRNDKNEKRTPGSKKRLEMKYEKNKKLFFH